MLTNTIKEPQYHFVCRGDSRIKAVADKAKRLGYRVWLNTQSTCFPEGTYGLIASKDEQKLVYFQMEEFNAYVSFTAELVPSRKFGSGYYIGDESMTTVEKIENDLNIAALFECVRPQTDRSGHTHNVLSLYMKEHDQWGLRGFAEY